MQLALVHGSCGSAFASLPFGRAGLGFAAQLLKGRTPCGAQRAFHAPVLIAAKPVKPCDGAVFGALNLLLKMKQNAPGLAPKPQRRNRDSGHKKTPRLSKNAGRADQNGKRALRTFFAPPPRGRAAQQAAQCGQAPGVHGGHGLGRRRRGPPVAHRLRHVFHIQPHGAAAVVTHGKASSLAPIPPAFFSAGLLKQPQTRPRLLAAPAFTAKTGANKRPRKRPCRTV